MPTTTITASDKTKWLYVREGKMLFVGMETLYSPPIGAQLAAHEKMKGFGSKTTNAHRDLMSDEPGVFSMAAPGFKLTWRQRLFWKATERKLKERLQAANLPITTA